MNADSHDLEEKVTHLERELELFREQVFDIWKRLERVEKRLERLAGQAERERED